MIDPEKEFQAIVKILDYTAYLVFGVILFGMIILAMAYYKSIKKEKLKGEIFKNQQQQNGKTHKRIIK